MLFANNIKRISVKKPSTPFLKKKVTSTLATEVALCEIALSLLIKVGVVLLYMSLGQTELLLLTFLNNTCTCGNDESYSFQSHFFFPFPSFPTLPIHLINWDSPVEPYRTILTITFLPFLILFSPHSFGPDQYVEFSMDHSKR